MGKTTTTIISDILPVALILFLIFFFLETALGKKILTDLWNLITKGINPVSSSKDSNNQTDTVIQNSNTNGNGGGSGSETLIPPPDVSHSLDVKNSGGSSSGGGGSGSGTGNGGGGQTQTSTAPAPVTAPTTTNSQRPVGVQVLSPVEAVKKLFSGSSGFEYPVSNVYYNTMPEQNTSKQPSQTAKTAEPVPNPTQTIDQINASEKIPSPLPKTPDLLTQVETGFAGAGNTLVNGLTAIEKGVTSLNLQNIFKLQPAPFDFFSTAPKPVIEVVP